MKRILLVEDDQNFGAVLQSYLQMNGYEVKLSKDGEEGLSDFKNEENIDLCIFDVMMPKKDGFQLTEEVRELDAKVPIIFLTAKNQEEDIIRGLKIGADDYMTKPFNSEELLLRVEKILQRVGAGKNKVREALKFEFGNFTFDYALRDLIYDKEGEDKVEFKLSPKEAQLLRMFCESINEVLPREEALNEIWGASNYFTARSMDVFVTKLRKYLRSDKNLEIVNIHGNGFRLVDRRKVAS